MIKRFFTALNDALLDADESGDAETHTRAYAFGNALFEGIFDKRAPGASSQRIQGHDHTDSTVSGYQGGRPLARHVCYNAYRADNSSVYYASPSSASSWVSFDEHWSSTYQRTTNTAAELFRTYISAGWDSTGTGTPSSPPYLNVRLLLNWTPTASSVEWDVRVKNIVSGRYSQTQTVISTSTSQHIQWMDITLVPASDGWCGFDIEVLRRNGSASDVLYCDQFVMYEDIDHGTIGTGQNALGMP